MSIVIGVVLGGHHTARTLKVCGSELEAFFFFLTFLKIDQLNFTPSPLKMGKTVLVVISKLWHPRDYNLHVFPHVILRRCLFRINIFVQQPRILINT